MTWQIGAVVIALLLGVTTVSVFGLAYVAFLKYVEATKKDAAVKQGLIALSGRVEEMGRRISELEADKAFEETQKRMGVR